MDIKKEAYELYKMDWEHSHGITGNRKLEAYRDYITIEKENSTSERLGLYGSFERYLDDVGYGGEQYSCYNEFLEYEYMDVEYIHYLLADKLLIDAYRFDLMKSAMELAGWHLSWTDGEQTLWKYAPTKTEDGLPFPEVENSKLPVENSHMFSLVKSSYQKLLEYLEDIIFTDQTEELKFLELVSAAKRSFYPTPGYRHQCR